ncbi:putative mediator of RNA polymerase II transcription subunit 26 isoform X2 [Sitodiplosis mosellana]|uniref:putative mediator of RNA polymerase II transcription subunit 26 isoform X2 n=1 Tax=Sitodiplosis mosellana TaxID=263140 RepID=UPI0024439375|nr:putative mediator of RNA polymerase II transcription subunit 26 isoform X2 [Sitodiplosis mosellana]
MQTENHNYAGGVKRVTWPPEHEYQARAASLTRQSPGLQPQHRQPSPHPHYQNGGHNPSGHSPAAQYRQLSPAANYKSPQANYPGQYYQSPSSNYPQSGYQQQSHLQPSYQQQLAYQQQGGYKQPSQQLGGYQQPSEHPGYQQPGYQRQISEKSQYPCGQDFNSPDPTYLRQSTPSYLPTQQQSNKPPSCTAAFTGGISVGNKAQAQAKNQGNWSHVQPSRPVHVGYVQPQYNKQSQPPFQNEPAYAVNQNQYQPQQPYHQQQQQQQHQYQQAAFAQPSAQQHQYQTNQSVQPQPQKQYRSEDNFYRQPSPGTITLRKELPVTQRPSLLYASEPAAYSFGGGGNMRGDNKWPPEEYKKQSEIENEQRRQLALGPAFRPRRVNKDYTPFFNRHALNATYPGYKAPPGTQHYGYQYPQYPQYPQFHK